MTDPVMSFWLREAITERLELARAAIHSGGGEWRTGCRYKGECHDYPGCCRVEGDDILIYDEGGHSVNQADHIAANDPRDVIARCEGELAILGEHHYQNPGDCGRCRGVNGRTPFEPYPCRTVRLLAAGYRYRPGWKAEWAP